MKIFLLIFSCFSFLTSPIWAQEMPVILPLRDRAQIMDDLLEDRLRSVLPALMRREGFDMWVIAGREYNEDPVLRTMLPATWLSARRNTVLVVFDKGEKDGLELLAVARYDVGRLFKRAWDPEAQPDQWARLAEIVAERNPKKIGVNLSNHFAHADGLTKTQYDALMQALPKKLHDRVQSAEKLAIAWLETRSEREMVIFEQINRMTHLLIAEAFSERVIQPGVTTTDDVVWWLRERVAALRLDTWFQPSVDVQRNDPASELYSFAGRPGFNIIQPGDLLHVDFGITYLGLNSDVQQHAYVLRKGETGVPAFLQRAFEVGNRTQDILTEQFAVGKTGNQVLLAALEKAKAENNKATIYTHPIGYHGHAAGPTIGLWDQQGGVPHNGDYPLFPNTAYSIELNTRVYVPEWRKEVRIMLEEDAFFDGKTVDYIDGRQRQILPIPRAVGHLGR